MMPSYYVLANVQPAASSDAIIWPWFIIGCVLLFVAIVAFFWAFALKTITSSQHFLLMWILPLSTGFAVGSFAGSLRVTGSIGQLAITAAGGFGAWLLSYFLLPKPSSAPPDSLSTNLPKGMSFLKTSKFLADLDGYSVRVTGFDDSVLNAKIKAGQMTAGGILELLESLRDRFVDESIKVNYSVVRDTNRGLYLIDKL